MQLKLPGLSTLYLLIHANGAVAQENYWLGDARGPYPTGTFETMWIDESRLEVTTPDVADRRRVMVQAWYPVEDAAAGTLAPYASNAALYQDYVQDWSKDIANTPTRSLLNAEVRDGTYPVLLYSHGGNSPLFTGTAQTEFLASHGYVVVSVAHTDDSAIERFPDGSRYLRAEPVYMPSEQESAGWSQLEIYRWQKEHLQAFHKAHVEDLAYALGVLTELNQMTGDRLFGHLDLDSVGAFGWSRGGATSFQASVDDARIKAAVNIDGTMFGRPIEQTGSTRPLLLLEGTDSYYDPLNDREADPEIEELWASVEADWWGLFRRSTHAWHRGRIVGSSHTQFSDFPLAEMSSSADAIAPQRVRDITNAVLLEFFDRYLKNAGDAPILSGRHSYPELRMVGAKPAQ